ncbi:MAG: YdcH family protein [Devosia sp.]
MTTEGHMEALVRRHRELDRKIEDELTHPSHDELYVAALKRKKLEIKDALAKYQLSDA